MVLVAYATRYGSTHEVAEVIAETFRDCGLTADVRAVKDVPSLTEYNAIVLGAPLIMYRWHKDARRFLSRHRKILTKLPVALFVLGPVQAPYNEKEWKDSHDQLNKELAKFPWLKPVTVEILGGRFDPSKLGFPLKMFAGKEPASDIRDWTMIRKWAVNLAEKLKELMNKSQGS
jgi:menaquinone-dependent protoporphyrinogen oxidase